ncbi:hypothetical protein IV203_014581 [Nitzschia inconspicua]|uniref:Protein kinase domain-containing protein n=1 Tax=Nitzschia inconspicua TaxID=303405 RepID=A0A9K3L8Y5_9STRA|nr:hypothetical protein IV203_014581 [Nitzschia inconspicua]
MASSLDPNADDAISKKQSNSKSHSSGNENQSSLTNLWDYPGRSTSNRGGLVVAHRQLRSVLFHPLGLPLLFAFLEKETEDMKYLPQTRTRFKQDQIDILDGLFQRAVEDAKDRMNNAGDNNDVKDKALAGCLTQLIEEQREILSYGALSEVSIKDQKNNTTGFLDMILTPVEKKVQASDTTPLAVLEFGWNADDWWKSFQRGTKYLEQMMHLVLSVPQVLRCYDNRTWKTDRNPEVYLSGVVGDVEVIFGDTNFGNHYVDATEPPNQFEQLWNGSSQDLLVIAVPYRHGRHYAKSPAEFLPIVDQLQALHRAGFVHGDIRGYNTVFKDDKEGWLIDFDFGGKINMQTYPKGYNRNLDDGRRLGYEGDIITKYHDWFALGKLMFSIHYLPFNAEYSEKQWTFVIPDLCTDDNIDALKVFLQQFCNRQTELILHPPFGAAVKKSTKEAQMTEKGATRSSLQ